MRLASTDAITYGELIGRDIYVKEHPDALPPIVPVWEPKVKWVPNAREIAGARLIWLWQEYLSVFPQSNWMEIIWARYRVDQPRLATVEQLQDLNEHFRSVLLTVPRRAV